MNTNLEKEGTEMYEKISKANEQYEGFYKLKHKQTKNQANEKTLPGLSSHPKIGLSALLFALP